MKQVKNYIGFLVVLATLFSCNNSSTLETPTEEVTQEVIASTPSEEITSESKNANSASENSNDIEQVTIGNQIWSVKNLDVSTFRNGDSIPEARTDEEWKRFGEAQKPAWCYYENNIDNKKVYGKLYNWYAVNDSRGLAPNGWHIPTSLEYEIFTKNLKSIRTKIVMSNASKYINNQLGLESMVKNTSGWNGENGYNGKSCNGTNETGFSALPGGYRYDTKDFSDNWFQMLGNQAFFWCSDESKENNLWGLTFNIDCNRVYSPSNMKKNVGVSVRCIKDYK